MKLYQTKKPFCTAKETINKLKRQPTEQKIFANNTCNEGLISKYIENPYNSTTNSNQKMDRGPEHCSQEDMRMANRHMRRCSTPPATREMQMKTTMTEHLICVRMIVINTTRKNTCWRRCGKKETLIHCWWEIAAMENGTDVPQKINIRPSNSSSEYLPKKLRNIHEHVCAPVCTAALFTAAKKWKLF